MKKEIYALIAAAVLLYLPYAWCFLRKEPFGNYGLNKKIEANALRNTLVITAVILAALTPIAFFINKNLPHARTIPQIISYALAGIAAAVIEETFFRGFLQTMLRKKLDASTSIIAASAIFAISHLILIRNPLITTVFFPSLVMGMLKEKYGNVKYGMIFHALGNIWAIWFFPFNM